MLGTEPKATRRGTATGLIRGCDLVNDTLRLVMAKCWSYRYQWLSCA